MTTATVWQIVRSTWHGKQYRKEPHMIEIQGTVVDEIACQVMV